MKNENIKHILSVNPETLRALHDCIGFDFQREFTAVDLGGSFTINRAQKAVTAAGYDSSAVVALIVRDADKRGTWRRKWHLVTLEGGRVNIEHSYAHYWQMERRRVVHLDDFATKGVFEELRKLSTCEAFAIVQRAEYIRKPAARPVDWRARFKVLPSKYAGNVELQTIGEKGRRFEYFRERYGVGGVLWPEEKEERQAVKQAGAVGIIDKSGYLLTDRRREWKRRAAALRSAREKAAADAQDYSAQIEELRQMIAARKAEIMRQFEAATTHKELYAVEKALSWAGGLGDAVRDFENFQQRAAGKKFGSPAQADRDYKAIVKKLTGEEA